MGTVSVGQGEEACQSKPRTLGQWTMTSSTLVRPTATGDSSVVSNSVCVQQTRIGQTISRLYSWDVVLLGLAAFNSFFQIVWFWKYASKNINYDAVSYIGIARHILDGNFRASLHGYWSPLISWCIVAGSLFSSNLLLVARVVTICSFLLCLPLVYRLSWLLGDLRSSPHFPFSASHSHARP